MLLAQLGMLLLVPTLLSLLALLCLLAAVQLQVRIIEEPYLLLTYGDAFASYAARTGRLLPGIGRLRPPTPRATAVL
jgi:protein-S-isoprenylcysteine O-methyltransferase Ste14